jgi:hypothetical protein
MPLTEANFKVELKCKHMELKHDLTNLLPRLSKARLQQFLDQLFQPQVTNVNPLAQRMTNPAKLIKQISKYIKSLGHV